MEFGTEEVLNELDRKQMKKLDNDLACGLEDIPFASARSSSEASCVYLSIHNVYTSIIHGPELSRD